MNDTNAKPEPVETPVPMVECADCGAERDASIRRCPYCGSFLKVPCE